jgi:hypothetical protein
MKIDYGNYALSPKMWTEFDGYYGDKSYREADWVEGFVQTVREESVRELEKLMLTGEVVTLTDALDKLREPTTLGDGWVWAYGEPITEAEWQEKYGKEF